MSQLGALKDTGSLNELKVLSGSTVDLPQTKSGQAARFPRNAPGLCDKEGVCRSNGNNMSQCKTF